MSVLVGEVSLLSRHIVEGLEGVMGFVDLSVI